LNGGHGKKVDKMAKEKTIKSTYSPIATKVIADMAKLARRKIVDKLKSHP